VPTNEELVRAIETSFHVYGPLPGKVEPLRIAGVRGRVTPISHPIANLVGLADLAPGAVETTVDQVRAAYGTKAFGWVVGPLTRPRELDARLASSGFSGPEEIAGMALTDLAAPIAGGAASVREVSREEALAESEMVGRAYGLSTEVARFFLEIYFAPAGPRCRGYFASVDDRPVAWSFLVYLDPPLALLGGAGTLPDHRGRGLYTALVARRLADARADGRTAAVIQAARGTSAPICAKLGFKELCGLELFVAPSAPET